MIEEDDFESGMSAKLVGDRLQWIEPNEYIIVDDLPLEFIASIMDLPCYSATHIVQSYLDEIDELVNDGWS